MTSSGKFSSDFKNDNQSLEINDQIKRIGGKEIQIDFSQGDQEKNVFDSNLIEGNTLENQDNEAGVPTNFDEIKLKYRESIIKNISSGHV